MKLDKHGHFVLEHDLHNHNGDLPAGIAEAFIDFAKYENFLSGVKSNEVFNCKKSQVCEVSTLRFDAEYYEPKYLDILKCIEKKLKILQSYHI